MQGTAADLIKVAMIRIDRRIREEGLRARMLVQIHDELLLEVPPEEHDSVGEMVVGEMAGAMDLAVPVVVDSGWGENWSDAH
jgi:DNA polymerase-1